MGCEDRTVFYFLVSLFWAFYIYYLAMAILIGEKGQLFTISVFESGLV